MKKIFLIVLTSFIFLITPDVKANADDCQYFVLPELGINAYQACLQNPSQYSQYFVYHTVRFYDGTTLLSTQSVRDNDAANAPSAPTKEGYEFEGWSKNFSSVTSDLNVYAVYSSTTYTVTYMDYNGNLLKQESVPEGGTGNPPTPARTGYDFTGWSGSYINVTSNRTLFAEYSIKTFTVRFLDEEGNVLKSAVVNYNGSVTPPTPPEVDGKTFSHWNQSYTNIKSTRDILAVYDENTSTVTFMVDDVVKVEEVPYGEAATAPEVTKEGHTFLNWDQDFSNVVADITINAVFSVNVYTVSFQDDLGNLLKTEEVIYLESATPPTYTKEGYTFLGWDQNYSAVKNHLIIKPILDVQMFIVKMIDYDGSVYLEESVAYGESASSVIPEREGYEFIGLSENCSEVYENKTVVLMYEPLTYTVSFYDGEELLKQELVSFSGCATPPEVQKEGHTLIGWDLDYCNIQSDMSIQAQYDANEYTVTFLQYDGTVLGTRTVSHGDSAMFPEPLREGYHFTGWSDSLIITNNITLVAGYEENQYTVVFMYQDRELYSTTVRHNGTVEPPEVEIEGLTIVGWSHSTEKVTEHIIVTAITEKNTYKVTFMNYDMTILSEQYIPHAEDAIPPTPSREGYIFTGWNSSYENIKGQITIIAQYKPYSYTVTYLLEDKIVHSVEVEYGQIAPQIEGYQFEEVYVYKDITVEVEKICTNTYWIEEERITLPCAQEPAPPTKEGFIFTGWIETERGFEAEFSLDEHTVTFIVGDYMESIKVSSGEVPEISLYLHHLEVEWDDKITPVYSDVIFTGYVDPEEMPEVNIEHIDGVYLLEFKVDISSMDIMYVVIDGELRSADEYYIERDKTNLFDRKANWFKIHIPEEEQLERVYLSDGKEYRYTVEDHLVESDFFKRIIRFVTSIFS